MNDNVEAQMKGEWTYAAPALLKNANLRLERFVAAVAEGWVFGVLAIAEPDFFGFGKIELFRSQTGAFVAAIAAWLMTTQAAGAPPMISSWQFNSDGLFFVNLGECFHEANLAGLERIVKVGKVFLIN